MTNEEAKEIMSKERDSMRANPMLIVEDCLYEAFDMAIKALEMVNDFETAQIITGGRLNGRTYAYKCGLADGQRSTKAVLDKIEDEINSPNRGTCDYFIVDRIEEIIDKYKAEREG